MEKKDNLPNIIAFVALVLYVAFAFFVSRPKDNFLQGGDIQKAIETNQYR